MKREMPFKMERPGLVEVGDAVNVTEGVLPSNYYYTLNKIGGQKSVAMSPNYPFPERLRAKEGVVTAVEENARGFYVTAVFEEPD